MSRFSFDYETTFQDLQTARGYTVDRTREDFRNGLSCFLRRDCGMGTATASAVAGAVWERMTAADLHYHTPWHVLYMLCFAEKHGMRLEPWEELAVWFHDSVYWPGTGFGPSEHASALFMEAMLPPGFDWIKKARVAVLMTASHLERYVAKPFDRLLDLDLCHFLAENETMKRIDECLRLELMPGKTSDERKWHEGRAGFLKLMANRGFVFRTSDFRPFEEKGMSNLQGMIRESENLGSTLS